MPAHAGLILVLGYVTWSGVANTLWYVLHVMDADQSGMLLLERHDQVLLGVLSACLLVAFFSVPLLSWGIDLAQNAQLVEEQLHTFRMQDTLCFCCSNQHRHPDTGAEIPCDRELVYLKLKEWYGHPEDGDEDGLLSLSAVQLARPDAPSELDPLEHVQLDTPPLPVLHDCGNQHALAF